jgi:hypothetical protein
MLTSTVPNIVPKGREYFLIDSYNNIRLSIGRFATIGEGMEYVSRIMPGICWKTFRLSGMKWERVA